MYVRALCKCVVYLYAHKRITPSTFLKAMPRPSSNDSGVPAVVIRAKMPAAGKLSDLIFWFHGVVAKHAETSKRWAADNRELRNLCDRLRRNLGPGGRPKGEPLTPDQKREKAAEYQRRYRARVRADKEAMLRKTRQEDWAFWKARDEAKKKMRREKWAKRFPWKKRPR